MVITVLTALGLAILGWLTGCVINHLVDTLPSLRSSLQPACQKCNQPQGLLPYIFFKPCRICGSHRARRDWFVQAILVFQFPLIWFFSSSRLNPWLALLVAALFNLILIIDFEYKVVVAPTINAGLVICLIAGLMTHGIITTLLGGILGFLVMWILHKLGSLFVWYLSRRRHQQLEEVALGMGDVWVMGILGLILGWPGILAGLLLGIILGGIFSGALILVRIVQKTYQPNLAIPYTPFLILSAMYLLYIK